MTGITEKMSTNNEHILCLVMILGNESKIITRSLESMADHIDYWVIHCNGSDDTADIVENYFKERGIPGELERNKWVDFGHNRRNVMKAAYGKAKYLLLPDADFIFMPKVQNIRKRLKAAKADAFEIGYEGNNDYRQCLCVSGNLHWDYECLTHEYIYCQDKNRGHAERCDWFMFLHLCDGGSRSDKFERDIRLCKRGLTEDSKNESRYMFYLANSYRDHGDLEDAMEWYEKRGSCTGAWFEETYVALLELAKIKQRLNKPFEEVLDACLRAFKINPARLEALFLAVRHLRLKELYHIAYDIGKRGSKVEYPEQKLFIDRAIHQYDFLFEYAICCYHTGHVQESSEILTRLLDEGNMPEHYKEQAKSNLECAVIKLNEIRLQQLKVTQNQQTRVAVTKVVKSKGRKRK